MFGSSGSCSVALVAIAVTACSVVQNERAADPSSALSEPVFRCNVEPILVRQCSYNACHGIAGAALRVYSPGKLRAIQPANIDVAIGPLEEGEHHANFESAAAFNFGLTAIDDNFLLRKPLPAKDGGYEHAGGVIWSGPGDPQFAAIRAWITNSGACK